MENAEELQALWFELQDRVIRRLNQSCPPGADRRTQDGLYAEHRRRGGPISLRPYYDLSERYEFVGNLAPEHIQRKYIGKSVKAYFSPGAQNPIKYVNC